MKINKKLNLEINDVLFDYKFFDTLKSLNKTSSQRKSAKELGISHSVLNRRIIKAEKLLSQQLVLVSKKGSSLTDYAKELLESYEIYEERLQDNNEMITVVGGPVSCEFIKELSISYKLNNLRTLETDIDTAYDLANKGMADIIAFDDPVQAYLYDLEPIALGRDYLVLLSHNDESFDDISQLDGLSFVEVEGSIQRLAWSTLVDYNLNFDIVSTVKSFHEAIRMVEQNENLYTFINNSMSYTSQYTNNILSKQTHHIISALNVKNDSLIESFLNFASHNAQNLTVTYGFEHLLNYEK